MVSNIYWNAIGISLIFKRYFLGVTDHGLRTTDNNIFPTYV